MSNKGKIRVKCIQCPKCKDIIYSRARHDFHKCSCGRIHVDGGFDYLRYGWNNDIKQPKEIIKYIKATKSQLYDDWDYSRNKFGIIKAGK